jgi:hypothetical protein
MTDLQIDLECPRADYEFVPPSAEDRKDPIWQDGYLIRNDKLKLVRPTAKQLENAVNLLIRCGPDQLPRVAVEIANRMGGLYPGDRSEPLGWWGVMQTLLRQIFAGKVTGKVEWRATKSSPMRPSDLDSAQHVGNVSIYLIPDKETGMRLVIRPNSLFQALPLVAARTAATGTTKLSTCKHCNTPFLSGRAGRGKGRRSDSRFCSDKCRYSYHNEAKRKSR